MQPAITPLSVVINDTLANINSGAPYASGYRGHYAAVSDGSALYWIASDGNIQLVNFNVSGYTGFTVSDGANSTDTIGSGSALNLIDGAGIDVVAAAGGVTFALAGAGAATAGQALVSDGAGSVSFAAPLAIAAASANFASINASNELVISQLLISNVTETATADIAAFVAAEYANGDEYQESDVIIFSNGTGSYIHNGGNAGTTADFTRLGNPSGAIQSFSIAGDTGSANTIVDGETFSVLTGTAGLASVATADTITLNLTDGLASLGALAAAPVVAGAYVPISDGEGGVTWESTDTFTSLADADQTLTGARQVIQGANLLTFTMGAGESVAFSDGGIVATAGDIEIATAGNGFIGRSGDGTGWKETFSDLGVPTYTAV